MCNAAAARTRAGLALWGLLMRLVVRRPMLKAGGHRGREGRFGSGGSGSSGAGAPALEPVEEVSRACSDGRGVARCSGPEVEVHIAIARCAGQVELVRRRPCVNHSFLCPVLLLLQSKCRCVVKGGSG